MGADRALRRSRRGGLGFRGSPSGDREGFSLLELIVVLILLSVMMAMVTPIFRGSLIDARIDQSLRDLVMTMGVAQSKAITDGIEYRVYFRQYDDTYWIMRPVLQESGDMELETLHDSIHDVRRLPERLIIDHVTGRRDSMRQATFITFYPSGASDLAEIRLTRTDLQRKEYSIKTSGVLGIIEVEER